MVSEPRLDEDVPDKSTSIQDIADVRAAFENLGDSKSYKIRLLRDRPKSLPDGTQCHGFLTELVSPGEIDDLHIRDNLGFGGGIFRVIAHAVGKRGGFKMQRYFEIAGAPRMPEALRNIPAAGDAHGQGNGHSDAAIVAKVLDQNNKQAERAENSKEDMAKRLLDVETAKARAVAELEALKAQPAREERESERAMKFIEVSMTAQREAHEARVAALQTQLEQTSSGADKLIAMAIEPYKQLISTDRARAEMASKESEVRFQQMIQFQAQLHQQSMTQMQAFQTQQLEMMRQENARLREEMKANKGDKLGEVSTIIDAVMKISKKVNGEPDQPMTPLDRLIDAVATPEGLERLPALLAMGRGLLTGQLPQGVTITPPPPLPPAADAAPPQPQPASEEQVKLVAQIILTLKDCMSRNVPPEDTAKYITSTIGKDARKAILGQPVDAMIQFLSAQDEVFATAKANGYIRAVYGALSGSAPAAG